MSNIFVGNNQAKKIYLGSTLLAEIKQEQTKSVTISSNGTTTITPDSGKTLSGVTVTSIVPQMLIGTSVWFLRANTQTPTQVTGISWNSAGYFEKIVNNSPGDGVFVTTDGQPPAADLSNICLYYSCLQLSAGGSFVSLMACLYTDGTHTGPIYLTV